MTYVASPSHSMGDYARLEDLCKYLDTARRHLSEASPASDAEKEAELIASAVDAGWDHAEVRSLIGNAAGYCAENDMPFFPTIDVFPALAM
jgi:uncharacterized protein YhjY with autotransporter beta-barrel domain